MKYDLIIIGGGHNGLTTAALQARRGRQVLVVEARKELGGLAAGTTFHPGYRTTGILHDSSLVRSSVVDGIGLRSHGLRRRSEPTAVFAPQAEGPGLLLHREPEQAHDELVAHSSKDAERYAAMRAFEGRLRDYLRSIFDSAPPTIAPHGIGQHLELFKKGWGLRKLGRETMAECLRIGPMSIRDWLDEYFESDLLKAALAAPSLTAGFCGPYAAGTTALTLMQDCLAENEIEGGPAALVAALVSACQQQGVTLRTDAKVQRIVVHNGKAQAIELQGGEQIEAGAIASSIDPRQTFLGLIEPGEVPPGVLETMPNWRCRGTTAKLHLALNGPLEFSSRPGELFEAIRIGENLTELERASDCAKYRTLPEQPLLDIRVPTVADKSLAPEGHHVASILVHFAPYDLDGGWSDARKDELLQHCLGRLSSVALSCRDRIVGHELLTPVDLEQQYGLTGGHLYHGEHGLDQLLSLRPHARCARYATEIEGLYLCGSGSHPGGGISGAPGMLAAAAIR